MAKRGRKPINIDKKQFENLCGLHCTQIEICSFFDIDENTLNAWCKRVYKKNFSEVFKQKKGTGKISLRRRGWLMTETVPSVWIFHAKNYLGMKDNPDEMPESNTVKSIADAIRIMRGEAVGTAQKTD